MVYEERLLIYRIVILFTPIPVAVETACVRSGSTPKLGTYIIIELVLFPCDPVKEPPSLHIYPLYHTISVVTESED